MIITTVFGVLISVGALICACAAHKIWREHRIYERNTLLRDMRAPSPKRQDNTDKEREIHFVTKKSRKIRLEEQFGHACGQIASSLSSGSTIDAALRSVAAYTKDPLRGELLQVVSDIRTDPDVASALYRMAERTQSRDVLLLASTVDAHARRGGSMAQTVAQLAETIGTRQEMRQLIRSESSSGKASAKAVIVLTVLLAMFVFAAFPDSKTFYLFNPLGHVVLVIVVALFIIGTVWMARICNIDCD